MLIQFPPSIVRAYAIQLKQLLSCVSANAARGWQIAVKFRNSSWYEEEVYDLLNFQKAAIVIQDKPKAATPILHHHSDFVYLRFHGHDGNHRGSYSEDFLAEHASLVNDWL